MPKWRIKLKQYTYYIIIAVISLLSLIIIPLIGTDLPDIKAAFPSDAIGWCLYIGERILVIIMNFIIFDSFVKQARINIKDDENFKKANEILAKNKPKEYRPKSEKKYLSEIYLKKGTSLVITSVMSLFVIGTAILNYDYMLLIATTFSVISCIVFGILTMKKVELYYTGEYYDYALTQIKEEKCIKSEIMK